MMNDKYKIYSMSTVDVRAFQVQNGLTADGMVGIKTMNKMLETGKVRKGSEVFNEWLVRNRTEYDNSRVRYPSYMLYK